MRNSLLQWGLKTFQDILLQHLFPYTKISNQLSLKFSNISPENTKSMVQSIGSILFTFSWMKAYINWTTKVKHSTKIQTQWAEIFFHTERQNNNKTQVNEFGYVRCDFTKLYQNQGRHGEFEPGKVQYSTPKFFDRLFLIHKKELIETQNLGKDQTLPAFPAMAALKTILSKTS